MNENFLGTNFYIISMSKFEVKRLISSCPGLHAAQKSLLRSSQDRSIVCCDSIVNNDGTLISIDELLLVISDNTADRKGGKLNLFMYNPSIVCILTI